MLPKFGCAFLSWYDKDMKIWWHYVMEKKQDLCPQCDSLAFDQD